MRRHDAWNITYIEKEGALHRDIFGQFLSVTMMYSPHTMSARSACAFFFPHWLNKALLPAVLKTSITGHSKIIVSGGWV